MEMRSGPKVSGCSRRVAADQGWSLRGVPLYWQVSGGLGNIGRSVGALVLGILASVNPGGGGTLCWQVSG